MNYVWVASTGCIYEGGSVDGVFATKEEAVKCALSERSKYGVDEGSPWAMKEDTEDCQTWDDGCYYVAAIRWEVK